MSTTGKSKLQTLCRRLNYVFKDTTLLQLALTHRSHSDANNERLEFLGDALLNFCIAKELFQTYPSYREGALSRLRAHVVNGDVLATLAKELGVHEYIRLGAGELKSGGLERKSTLADSMEAIIGAIYLDGGITTAMQCITNWFSHLFMQAAAGGVKKDPKTQLQEYLQAQKISLPTYSVLSIKGREHDQVFRVECKVLELPHTALGLGGTRKRAEQDAAAKLLALLQVSV